MPRPSCSPRPGHEGKVYELSGDVAWTQDDLAAAISTVTGKTVVYTPVSTEQHAAILKSAGLDEGTIGFVTTLDSNIADGVLAETSGELRELIGRPTTPARGGPGGSASGPTLGDGVVRERRVAATGIRRVRNLHPCFDSADPVIAVATPRDAVAERPAIAR